MLAFESSAIHICVVANIVVPNLSPLLDSRLGCKKVVLIHTPDFAEKAEFLARVYRRYQIEAEFFLVRDMFDIDYLREQVSRLLLRYFDAKPLVNVTTGTKPVSIVLYEQARALEFPVYYLNTNDSVSWFWPPNQPQLQLDDRIKLPAFLLAHGVEVQETVTPKSDKQYRELLQIIIENLADFTKAIGQLNYYAMTASKLVSSPLKGNTTQLERLLDFYAEAGLLKLKNGRIYFENEGARFFANGGWLEEYLFHQIKQLSSEIPEIQDNLMSTVVESDNGVVNEIDNMALVNNNLYVIESKTKRFKDDGNPDGGAVQSIYKLETLMGELGGPLAKGMVVSVFPFSEADKKRAKQYNIEIVTLEQLANIKHKLREWFKSPKRF